MKLGKIKGKSRIRGDSESRRARSKKKLEEV